MNAYEIADLLKMTKITSIPLRVAAYSRVSTDSLEQKTSIVNQTESHREFIEENPAWTFAGEYIDEGISGLSVRKRDEFNRMIRDAEEGKFDLIITKAVTRFARNTLDSLRFTRDLKTWGVGVWFLTDNILTFDSDSELRLSIMSMIAQEESVKKSEAVRAGLHLDLLGQNIKRRQVLSVPVYLRG
ncbi:MAG: recombinase family protein [Clostridia bacterium]|nr:recombinase family protein [Clostridia bacterium]